MKHTPGPWKYSEAYDKKLGTYYEVTAGDWPLANIFHTPGLWRKFGYKPQQNVKSDARLIAAAPDLLAACERALETLLDIQNNEGYPTVPSALRTAINKAKGE